MSTMNLHLNKSMACTLSLQSHKVHSCYEILCLKGENSIFHRHNNSFNMCLAKNSLALNCFSLKTISRALTTNISMREKQLTFLYWILFIVSLSCPGDRHKIYPCATASIKIDHIIISSLENRSIMTHSVGIIATMKVISIFAIVCSSKNWYINIFCWIVFCQSSSPVWFGRIAIVFRIGNLKCYIRSYTNCLLSISFCLNLYYLGSAVRSFFS